MPQKTPNENDKLTLDEGAFQRLLSAAFVIQEHNDSLKNQTPDPVEFKASDLSEIAETQNLIRSKRLDLLTAAAVIVERAQKISHAASGAIALLSKRELSYISSNGVAAPPIGTTVSLDESLSAECVRTGQSLLLPNLKAVARSQAELFLSRGVQSFAVVPIHQERQVAGVMELFFNRPNAIDGPTSRACQLLAGLLTGTVASQPDPILPPPAPTASLPLAPLDQLKPHLDRMLEEEDLDTLPGLVRNTLPEPSGSSLPGGSVSQGTGTNTYKDQLPVVRCRKCGCPLEAEESFCGLCGTARETTPDAAAFVPTAFEPTKTGADRSSSSSKPPAFMEPATPSAPRVEKAGSVPSPLPLSESLPEPVAGPPDIPEKSEALPPELQEILARFPEETEIILPLSPTSASGKIFDSGPIELAAPSVLPNSVLPDKDAQAQTTPPGSKLAEPKPTEPKPPVNAAPAGTPSQVPAADTPANPQWKSASETRAWLESVKVPPQRKHWMAEHRANLYLAAAAVLLLLVLFGVGMPAGLQGGKPQLSWFDSMLVNLGLAEAPSAPVYLGNPTTKVWVDLHTALYYCPNAELYGKTRGGKFETQREAQQDQFEPASRHACP